MVYTAGVYDFISPTHSSGRGLPRVPRRQGRELLDGQLVTLTTQAELAFDSSLRCVARSRKTATSGSKTLELATGTHEVQFEFAGGSVKLLGTDLRLNAQILDALNLPAQFGALKYPHPFRPEIENSALYSLWDLYLETAFVNLARTGAFGFELRLSP